MHSREYLLPSSKPPSKDPKPIRRTVHEVAEALVHFLGNAEPGELSNFDHLILGVTDHLDKSKYAVPFSREDLLEQTYVELNKIGTPSGRLQKKLLELLNSNRVWHTKVWGNFPTKSKLAELGKQWDHKKQKSWHQIEGLVDSKSSTDSRK